MCPLNRVHSTVAREFTHSNSLMVIVPLVVGASDWRSRIKRRSTRARYARTPRCRSFALTLQYPAEKRPGRQNQADLLVPASQ